MSLPFYNGKLDISILPSKCKIIHIKHPTHVKKFKFSDNIAFFYNYKFETYGWLNSYELKYLTTTEVLEKIKDPKLKDWILFNLNLF